jgi:hypothetical protein
MKKDKKTKITNKRLIPKMNKKGLWGLSDIANWWQAITGVMPKPVIFIIFLTIMLLLAQLLTFFFNMNGIFCTSSDIPVRVEGNFFTSLISNINLMSELPDPDSIGKEVQDVNTLQSGVMECSVCLGSGTIIYSNGSKTNFANKKCFYQYDGCVNCQPNQIVDIELTGRDLVNVCLKDAYPKTNEEKSFLSKAFCGAKYFGRCEPPAHYFYSANDNYYRCADNTCNGITAGDTWDNKLLERGAMPIYKTIESGKLEGKAYDEGIGISCKDLRPKLSFYRLDIFDFKIWIFILLLIMLIWIYKTFIG